MAAPETRQSLLLRLHDPRDREAWDQFVDLYQHVVYQMAVRRGMQPADADDLTQQVLMSVSGAITRFEPDNAAARFRTWLQKIARNAIFNAMTRRPRDCAAGGSATLDLLNEQIAPECQSEQLELEYRREVFLVAASKIQSEFQPHTWACFWETVVCNRTVDVVAQELGRNRGSVYTARCRVIARLREVVEQLDQRGEL